MVSGTVVGIIVYVLSVAGMWTMFRKAGRRGWLSIIPVVNTAILCLIGWNKLWPFVLEIVVGFLGAILLIVALFLGAVTLAGGTSAIGMALALLVIGVILMIVGVVIQIMMTHKVSKAFGHHVGYTILLLIFPFIMYPVIGFGKSEFIGVKGPVPTN